MDEDWNDDSQFEDEDSNEMNDDEEEEAEDTDDFRDFEGSAAENEDGKKFELEYEPVHQSKLFEKQDREISNLSQLLTLSESEAGTLLRHFKWNRERLIERFLENRDAVLQAAGVTTASNFVAKITPPDPKFCCAICCDDNVASFSLSCGHRFCQNCYSEYLTRKIIQDGESRKLQCAGTGCSLIVDKTVVRLLVDDKTFNKYTCMLYRTYLDDNDNIKWCPAPNCEFAILCHSPVSLVKRTIPIVQCSCNHRFCFNCGLPDHQPAVCSLLKLWLKKCEDDSETSNWISANTKECVLCKTTIEKNGGCNHMTCSKCKHEFCWVCLGPWSGHGTTWYNCNRYDDKTSEDARSAQAKSRASLDRYLHYYNRYANHDLSLKLEKELTQKIEKKMEEMQHSTDLSWIEVQFLKKAAETLTQCRMTLKYTYAFAYYLTRSNYTDIFEDNQRDLELAVENLSELLERPLDAEKIPSLRQNVLDKTVYVQSRREILLKDTIQGLMEERWVFNTKLLIFSAKKI